MSRNLSHETFRGGKKKTKKKKKSLKQKQQQQKKNREAKKYIDAMNASLKQIHSDKNLTIFTKEDDLLWTSGYLKRGIKKGWDLLRNKDVILELECNSLCMTVSIIHYELLSKKFDKLITIEKLYLFFLSYVITDEKVRDVTFDYAMRKMNLKIKYEEKKHADFLQELGEDHRRTKQAVKNIKRLKGRKEELIENEGEIPSGDDTLASPIFFRNIYKVDKCNNIDCEYLHEYPMGKTDQHFQTYEKFCRHLTFMFKGVIWINMCFYFGGFRTIPQIYPQKQILPLNLSIRKTMNGPMKKSIVLIPTPKMYKDMNLYSLEERERLFDKKGIVKLWVYRNLDIKTKTIEKVEISLLDDKKYIVATLWGEEYSIVNRTKNRSAKKVIDDLVNGEGKLPELTNIKKMTKTLGGREMKSLEEEIENTITIHWLVIHRDKLEEYIANTIF